MTLAIFPDISPSYTFEESLQFSTLIIPYGDLSEQRISRSNQPRITFKLQWNTLSASNKEILQQFFLDRKGSYEAFTFNHILPSQVIGTNGLNYICKKTHISTINTKPVTGDPDYSTYWIQEGVNGIPWVKGYTYKYDFTVKFKEDITTIDYFNYLLYNLNTVEFIEVEQPPEVIVHDVTANIISISPNPAESGVSVSFSGEGSDTLPHLITEYVWTSNIDGIIGTTTSFSKNNLSIHSHNISFKVKCSDNVWSPEIAWSGNPLVITDPAHDVTATIISITPNPAIQGNVVSFSGSGSDSLSHAITAYSWTSDIDGVISTTNSFTKSNLTVGSHHISFKVKCSDNVWSPEISWSGNPLIINPTVPGTSNWKNWYTIAWKDVPINSLKYAKQMGYDYFAVKYWPPTYYTNNATFSNMKFYIIDPMWSPGAYTDIPDFNNFINNPPFVAGGLLLDIKDKVYSQAQKDWYRANMTWKSNVSGGNWYDNIATGQYPSGGSQWWRYNVQWDFQQQVVIDSLVEKIISSFHAYENVNHNFTFAGYGIDTPLMGIEFRHLVNGSQVRNTLSYWTGSDTGVLHSGITHEYSTWNDGMFAFYKKLNIRMKQDFPNAKWFLEPGYIYSTASMDDYVYLVHARSDKVELTPDMLSEEATGTEFVDNTLNFTSGMPITKDMVGSSQNSGVGESINRTIAAKAGINGSWYNWFGRFGGTGDMPDFSGIIDVYSRLKFIRCIPNWDNLNNIPLVNRSWDGTTYISTVGGVIWSFMNANVYYTRFYKNTNKLFIVFINNTTSVPIPSGKSIVSIKRVNGYFEEDVNGASDVTITSTITLNSNPPDTNGRGYIVTLI